MRFPPPRAPGPRRASALLAVVVVLAVGGGVLFGIGSWLVPHFLSEAGLDHLAIDTGKLWHAGVALAVLGTCVGTLLTVLAAALYNLYAAPVGGVTVELHCRPARLRG